MSDSASGEKAEKHEHKDVDTNTRTLRELAPSVASIMGVRVLCKAADDGSAPPPAGSKLVHFIRHGEGYHNQAQREWRADPGWDQKSEPYTVDTDPTERYIDAELNEKGKAQAAELRARTAALAPDVLIVSPMRRATLTGLLAFEEHIARGSLPVRAHELCHERGGKHTCDKRLPTARLRELYPAVDYRLIESADDPLWGDGATREPWLELAKRAARFAEWLLAAPESHVAVAAHSAFLLSLFNAALECDADETRRWFATGEMRTVILTPAPKEAR